MDIFNWLSQCGGLTIIYTGWLWEPFTDGKMSDGPGRLKTALYQGILRAYALAGSVKESY